MNQHDPERKEDNVQCLDQESCSLPRRRGLTIENLHRLSPSMVTLESLISEWPPNTYDSGYVPSPQSSGSRFTYPRNDGHGVSDDEDFGCTPETGFQETVQCSSLHPQGKKTCFSPNVAHLSSHLEGSVIRAGTPPIKIPAGKLQIATQDSDTSAGIGSSGNTHGQLDCNKPYGELEFLDMKAKKTIERNVGDEREIDRSPSTRFGRPRTYSCPETSRFTPNRAAVPLFPPIISPVTPEVFDRQYADRRVYLPKAHTDPCTGKVQQYLCETPKTFLEATQFLRNGGQNSAVNGQEDQSNHGMGYGCSGARDDCLSKGYVQHTRFRSTPVTTASDGRPLLVPPTPINIKPSGSRDAIVNLSHTGPGHRRRVLVLSLPDVVVETSPSYRTDVDVTEDSTSLSQHTRENSSCSRDGLGPLRDPSGTSPVVLRPKRSTGRPRALSCDVTLEETVGRTLRHIADSFEPKRLQGRPESNSLFGRMRRSVRRSFSRILNTGADVETSDQPQQNGPGDDVFLENLFYFPYDSLDDDDNDEDFGEPAGTNSESRKNRNCDGRNSGDCKMCGGEYKCVGYPKHPSSSSRLRLVVNEVDGEPSYSFEQPEDKTYDFEYYL